MPKPKDFIDSEFPIRYRSLIPAALKVAYNAVEEIYKDTPLLSIPSAKYGKGDLIAYSVDFYLEGLLKSGQLPFDYSWASYERETGKYLQIRLPTATLSISQVPRANAVPRDAMFRNNAAFNNQLLLPGFEEDNQVYGLPHLILTHGYQDLTFAHIGLAHPTQRSWLSHTPNLMQMPHPVSSSLPAEEGIDIDVKVSLKELKDKIFQFVEEKGKYE